MSEKQPNPSNPTEPQQPGSEAGMQLSPEEAVLRAAAGVVDEAAARVAEDAPDGPPLPGHAFSDEDAVGAAVDVALERGRRRIAQNDARKAVARMAGWSPRSLGRKTGVPRQDL